MRPPAGPPPPAPLRRRDSRPRAAPDARHGPGAPHPRSTAPEAAKLPRPDRAGRTLPTPDPAV